MWWGAAWSFPLVMLGADAGDCRLAARGDGHGGNSAGRIGSRLVTFGTPRRKARFVVPVLLARSIGIRATTRSRPCSTESSSTMRRDSSRMPVSRAFRCRRSCTLEYRALAAVRSARRGLRTDQTHGLPARIPGGAQLQAPRLVPILRGAAHGGDGRGPGRELAAARRTRASPRRLLPRLRRALRGPRARNSSSGHG